jgi:iron uptake system EfeUOB component EfeO/EfeM
MATKKTTTKKVAPKKTVKSTVAKKAPKKSVTKSVRKKTPTSVSRKSAKKKCFWVYNGPVVDSVPHLVEALEHMSNEQYAYHARGEQNDFAVWLSDVFGCEMCATGVARARSKKGVIQALKKMCCL